MSGTITVNEIPASEVKEGSVYRVEREVESEYGYRWKPGELLITHGAMAGSRQLSAVDLATGETKMLYPVPATLPLTNITRHKGTKAKVDSLMRGKPGSFARLGASLHLGTDPEMFAVDERGLIIPAYTFLPDKDASAKRGYVAAGYHKEAHSVPYWDGFQGEFAVKPFACIAHLTDCVQGGYRSLLKAARVKYSKATLTAAPVLPIPQEILSAAEQKHVELGCMPSLNAYDDLGIPILNGRELPIRFAGFHMHFSLDPEGKKRIPALVRMIDKLCGVMSVVALQGLEDSIRRRYYGLAGEYRTPTHGLEWRVLSSAVAWHPAMVHLHFNMARVALQLGLKGLERVWLGTDEEARTVINDHDVERAKKILIRNRELYLGCIQDTYYFYAPTYKAEAFDKLIMPGVKEHIDLDVVKNWNLDGVWKDHSSAPNCQFQDFAKNKLGWPRAT